MRKIEEKFADEVVVIGVHSGKYIAERETPRIREATLRYAVTHPVVNDRQFRIWRAYAVRAWPTLTVIDRNGYVVGAHAGEFTAEMLDPLLEALVSVSRDSSSTVIPHSVDGPGINPSRLRYPGKVAVDGDRIAIADTGNHRVLAGTLATPVRMRLDREISSLNGRGQARVGALHSPQGVCYDGELLYVTDSATHTLCSVDLRSGDMRIVAGTGAQMRTQADRAAGALSSPWDVTVAGGTGYIAMAGVHQIWSVDITTGTSRIHCGTGGEDIRDGANGEALLAQPMGITTDGDRLFFADAESSAIRSSDISAEGLVTTVVGTGLFDFGDVDGSGESVRMQHQQGLTLHSDGRLLVADSYNDSLKWVDVTSREARTWLRGFHEPGGVTIGGRHAYIADTNAHRIMVAELETGNLEQLQISS